VVKGRQFVELRDAGDPVRCALRYRDEGIDEIVVLDVSATLESRLANRRTIEAIAASLDVPLTVGGGVRVIDDVARLLDAGADKVAINSAALDRPELLSEAAARFGSQCIVISVDARRAGDGYAIATRSASRPSERDPVAWSCEAVERGAGEVSIVTAVVRASTLRWCGRCAKPSASRWSPPAAHPHRRVLLMCSSREPMPPWVHRSFTTATRPRAMSNPPVARAASWCVRDRCEHRLARRQSRAAAAGPQSSARARGRRRSGDALWPAW
jgi:tRNA-dihydrouridine synthase